MASLKQSDKRKQGAGFTLAEVVVSIAILSSAMAGLVFGYIQTNRRAQWCSLTLAAQSLASQSVEQARAAKWDGHPLTPGIGLGRSDELPTTNYIQVFTNTLLVPATGEPLKVTNYVSITTALANPPVRQIRADCVWHSPFSETWVSNTVITYRMTDE